jgi:ribosomal protein S18 acetylase RimI-like enzyme
VSETAIRGYLESGRYRFTVAESNGRVLGFIAIRDASHLFHLFVSAEHHGQGIGRSLWQEGLTAASKGSRNSTFTVNSSPNAVPVYRRFGFVETGPLVQMHGVSFLPMRRIPSESDA